ncbi:hypothetical protein ACIPI6_13815 [Pseudomonas protegens]|uniref:hypothetical protein n=1 Tax=Pseudomonas protegens TaxID=380021 RepID=UPI0038071D23
MCEADKGKKEPGKSEGGSGLTSILNLIPSVYYDLIARICPGMAFWIVLAFKYPHEQLQPPDILGGALLFVLIILSYVSGIVFTGFAPLWDWLSIATLNRCRFLAALVGLADAPASSSFARWKAVTRQLDEVIQADDGAGKTLVKAMAEISLCQNLLTGCIALALIEIGFSACGALSMAQHPGFNGFSALALLVAMYMRQMMFLGRVSHLHQLHVTGH